MLDVRAYVRPLAKLMRARIVHPNNGGLKIIDMLLIEMYFGDDHLMLDFLFPILPNGERRLDSRGLMAAIQEAENLSYARYPVETIVGQFITFKQWNTMNNMGDGSGIL